MKKVLFVLLVATLTACGETASTEVKTDSTAIKQDSLAGGGVQVEDGENKNINQDAQN